MRHTYDNGYFNIDFTEDYSQFLNIKTYNWVDFTFFNFRVEADRRHGCFEIEFALLGLGIRLYWTYDIDSLTRAVNKYNRIITNKENFIKIDMRENYKRYTRVCISCKRKCSTALLDNPYVCEECAS